MNHLPLLALLALGHAAPPVEISDADAARIGRRLWQNECGGTVAGLTSWNQGEDFASLGIGHYLWYPRDCAAPFRESFPELVAYLKARGVALPPVVRDNADCPWNTREEFLAARDSPPMRELRDFLEATIAWQARFSAARLRAALPDLLAHAPPESRAHVEAQFHRVAAHPHGLYALVDYVNFKGEGTRESERYQGQGWGMLQVLLAMQGIEPGLPALREFSRAATATLEQRVRLSPPARNEARWLAGWTNRCRTYAQPDP